MPEFVTGVVKSFNGYHGWGFVVLDEGGEIFFHYNERSIIPCRGDQPYFTGRPCARVKGVRKDPISRPQPGDRVIGFIGRDREGRRALKPWNYLSHYIQVKEILSSGSEPTE